VFSIALCVDVMVQGNGSCAVLPLTHHLCSIY